MSKFHVQRIVLGAIKDQKKSKRGSLYIRNSQFRWEGYILIIVIKVNYDKY